MNKILASLVLGISSLGLTSASLAADDKTDAKSSDKSVRQAAADKYKADRAKCDKLKGNEKDVCVAQARAERTRTTAKADAASKDTSSARRQAQVDIAKAEYEVEKAKCDAMKGDAKDDCIKAAKTAREKSLLEPNTQEMGGMVEQGGNIKSADQIDTNKDRAGTRPERSSPAGDLKK